MGQLDCILTIFTLLFSRYLTVYFGIKPLLLFVSFQYGRIVVYHSDYAVRRQWAKNRGKMVRKEWQNGHDEFVLYRSNICHRFF